MSYAFPCQQVQGFWYPERFQGWGRTRAYFEGWYFKLVAQDFEHAHAIIPGIACDRKGDCHSFIQILDGKSSTSVYHKFPFDAFSASTGEFAIQIAENSFSRKGLTLNLPGAVGSIDFGEFHPWPSSTTSPGIMGPYAFAPFMECYHGVVSMDHSLRGNLSIGDVDADFADGRGYIEKDWGRSFPKAYVWMQSNNFSVPGRLIKVSVANIPWLTGAFVGFIGGVLLDGDLFQFTTYNGSRLMRNRITANEVDITIHHPRFDLEICAHRDRATQLASPILGAMEGRIEESMTSKIQVKLSDRKTGKILLEDTAYHAGMEVAGAIEEIII